MESGRVGSSPSTMPESREWADPFEMLESANGDRNIVKDSVIIHKELTWCYLFYRVQYF
jgi:hypothetical protein